MAWTQLGGSNWSHHHNSPPLSPPSGLALSRWQDATPPWLREQPCVLCARACQTGRNEELNRRIPME